MGRKRKRPNDIEHDCPEVVVPSHTDFTIPEEEGAHLYTMERELPWDHRPYWKQRRSMFSLYDNGIWTTDDSWFEVTHEAIARRIAQHATDAKPSDKLIMLDCFAGIGGNAIAFALSGYKRVYAIEKNKAALECARHNARIYGVHNQITFFHGDCFDLLGLNEEHPEATIESLAQLIAKAGIIFASPPWGGPGYKQAGNVFDLDEMPYTFDFIYSRLSKITKNLILYLPRTSDLNQMADCIGEDAKAQVVHYCTNQNSRALCAYLGDWKDITDEGK